jgi:hypothetical protein
MPAFPASTPKPGADTPVGGPIDNLEEAAQKLRAGQVEQAKVRALLDIAYSLRGIEAVLAGDTDDEHSDNPK